MATKMTGAAVRDGGDEVSMSYQLQSRLIVLVNMIENARNQVDGQVSVSPVRAIFSGAGDEELEAAEHLLAATLDVGLKRIDLSELYNQYRSESEHRLEQYLDQAQADHGVLLFDGVDALFGHDTAVMKEGGGRHRQLDVGYFLKTLGCRNVPIILHSRSYFRLAPDILRHFACVVDFDDGLLPLAVK